MDLVFARYSSPFLLINQMIHCGCFAEFIDEFIADENERRQYDYWVHKVWDMSFDEFKENNNAVQDSSFISEEEVGATVKESIDLLNNFKPQ